ncbi:DUF3043 domain-containing protein [Amycolatopsis rhizosphaerae]|uniref:DUF3043 domain-containing protein n=1 Tax=Amycolatopsis rhizosphaerae TaxID=2053003 RepID=A0A558CY83_9PSEU|nr:DUF3043 domain-containing protein [Amycolatopsis rhizosphaerae]TVT53680.1 DUF3043 domain-containing protein [Amycolatopsis rhizosphaerae]
MRFLRRSSTTTEDSPADEAVTVPETAEPHKKGYTPGKGRATPKRREAEGKRRGPVKAAPRSTWEAMKRARELRKANPQSKDERRAKIQAQREGYAAGDDRYVPARDRGPVKAYVRDLVDSRRNLLGLFMPLAILVFVSLLVPYELVRSYATLATTLLLLAMAVEGVLSGRRITRQVRAKFPKETVRGGSIGWYAFVRASQLRKLRLPKPRVKPGDKVD